MKVAIYARCSTVHQSTDLQLETLREHCRARGFELAGEYVDNGISGATADRPALKELMVAAKRRKFDAVIVFKLDRFARSLRHLVFAIGELNDAGVAFISFSDNIDLSTSQGRLMFAIIGAMAEFERELIRERVRAGVAKAIASGRKWGRRRIELDWSKVPDGATLRQAAEILGVSRECVRRAKTKPVAPAV